MVSVASIAPLPGMFRWDIKGLWKPDMPHSYSPRNARDAAQDKQTISMQAAWCQISDTCPSPSPAHCLGQVISCTAALLPYMVSILRTMH